MPRPGRPPLPDGPFLVVGLARSGRAAVAALRARGAEVVAVDSGPVGDAVAAELRGHGATVHADTDGLDALEGIGCVIKSPGVPPSAPVVAAAREQGVPVLGELELGWRLVPNPTVAVTGSNGKTTTVELLGHLFRTAEVPVRVAGNVGTPLTSLAGGLDPDVTVVAEASSFQLEDTEAFAPDAAVLLNLTPDHLDRHGTFDAYRDAKLRIFANQQPEDLAVTPLGFGLEPVATLVTVGGPGADLAEVDGVLRWRGEPLIGADELALPGRHNRDNAMAAAATALARGVDPDAVRAGLGTFAGVAHRLERVAEHDGVAYVNDSKATNVDAAVTGMQAYPGGLHVILGGYGPDGDLAALAAAVKQRANAAYLIGSSADRLREPLEATGVEVTVAGDLERAVALARAAAAPGETVLLSPAYKSFDQYPDFEARGEHFRALASRFT